MEALADDVNTPLALSVLHEIVNNLNKSETEADKVRYKSELIASAEVLGLLYQDPEVWFKGVSDEKGGRAKPISRTKSPNVWPPKRTGIMRLPIKSAAN